jgi:hydrogenase maturation protease
MRAKTLILGVGNSVRCDDGVGVHVAQQLEDQEIPGELAVAHAGTCGLGVLDLIAGFERLIIVDAIEAGEDPGTVLSLRPDEMDKHAPIHVANPHDTDLITALEAGRRLELDLPSEIFIVAIQIQDTVTFSESCTPEVAEAIDEACGVAIALASREPGYSHSSCRDIHEP